MSHPLHKLLQGKVISEVREMTEADEMLLFGYIERYKNSHANSTVLVFEDGSVAFIMSDEEGNGCGHIEYATKYFYEHSAKSFYTMS